jgi:hypothetical protein
MADLTRLAAALPYLAMRFADANAVLNRSLVREMLSSTAERPYAIQKPGATTEIRAAAGRGKDLQSDVRGVESGNGSEKAAGTGGIEVEAIGKDEVAAKAQNTREMIDPRDVALRDALYTALRSRPRQPWSPERIAS